MRSGATLLTNDSVSANMIEATTSRYGTNSTQIAATSGPYGRLSSLNKLSGGGQKGTCELLTVSVIRSPVLPSKTSICDGEPFANSATNSLRRRSDGGCVREIP